MDRNLILAIVLTALIIIVFQLYYQAYHPPQKGKAPTQTAEQVKDRPTRPDAEQPGTPAPGEEAKRARGRTETAVVEPPELTKPALEAFITVSGPIYEAKLSTKGAKILSFKLKDFKQEINKPELVDLVSPRGPDTSGPTLSFTRRDENFSDEDLVYTTEESKGKVTLTGKDDEYTLTFRTVTADGLAIEKAYTFHGDSYGVGLTVTLTNHREETANYRLTFPWKKLYLGEGTGRFEWNSVEILLNGDLKDYYFTKIQGDEEPSGKVEWAGLGDVYFFKALAFGEKPAERVTLFKPTKEGIAEIWIRYGAVDLPPGTPVSRDVTVYLGPKEHRALAKAGHSLDRALYYSDYMLLEVMSEYLMKFLRFSHYGFTVGGVKIPGTGNWGLDIILLTVFIKILFIPLTHKSMKSMKRMQDLQPEIQKLKEKHKDDKQAMNKATMELFRDHKVNPLGGCWPIFLQLPVFIALYQTLSYAIELRHASFVCIPSIYLCINDLSAPDPYYVTPILMGGTMVLQQWLTPSAGDPTQKKIMLIMPVVFTYLFLSFPSGLVLYWLISNVLSIGQQLLTNKLAK